MEKITRYSVDILVDENSRKDIMVSSLDSKFDFCKVLEEILKDMATGLVTVGLIEESTGTMVFQEDKKK